MANLNDTLAQIEELGRQGELTTESLAALMEEQDDGTETLKKLGNVTVAAASGVNNFTSAVINGNDKMTAMNGAISGFANALGDSIPYIGGLVKGLGKAVTFAIERYQASFESMQDLADAGVIGAEGISGLRDQFYAAGVPLEMYSGMLKKNAKDLSFIYGSSLKGSREFAKTMTIMNTSSNDQLRKLGFTTEQIGDTIINFQKTSARFGFKQELNANQLALATNKYGKELDLLSKLTGESKAVLQQERDERLRETKYRSMLMVFEKKHGAAAAKALDNHVAAVGKTLGKGAEEMLKSRLTGFAADDAGRRSVAIGLGRDIDNVKKLAANGKLTMEESFKSARSMGKKMGDFSERFMGTTQIIGDQVDLLADVAGNFDARIWSNKDYAEGMKDIINAQDAQINNTDKLTSEAINSQKTFQKANASFDKMILELVPAEMVVNGFATSLEWATDKLREALDLPALNSSSTSENKLADLQLSKANKNLANTEKKLAQSKKDGNIDEIRELSKSIEGLKQVVRQSEAMVKYQDSPLGKTQSLNRAISDLNKNITHIASIENKTISDFKTEKRSIELGTGKNKNVREEDKADLIKALTNKTNKDLDDIKNSLQINQNILQKKKNELLKAEIQSGSKTIEGMNKEREEKLKKLANYKNRQEEMIKNSGMSKSEKEAYIKMQTNNFKKQLNIPENIEINSKSTQNKSASASPAQINDLLQHHFVKFQKQYGVDGGVNPRSNADKSLAKAKTLVDGYIKSNQIKIVGPKETDNKIQSPWEKMRNNTSNADDDYKISQRENAFIEALDKWNSAESDKKNRDTAMLGELQNIVAHLGILNSTSQEGNKKMGDLDNTIGRSGFIANNNTVSV